jgi:hypothetical protein
VSWARYLRTVRQSQPLAADLNERGACLVQSAELTNVLQDSVSADHEQVRFGLVCLAADEPKDDPLLGRKKTQRAETDLHVGPYGERHMR